MTTNFRQVLRDMEQREAELIAELKDIQAAKPAIQRMANAQPLPMVPMNYPSGVFAALGTKDAILAYLTAQPRPRSVAEITKALLEGGIKTRSTDFTSVVKSTLGSLKEDEKVERKEDGWILVSTSSSDSNESSQLALQ